MFDGLLAGILWALDTVILGVAMSMTPFVSTDQAILLAPFVSTFLHDFYSTVYMFIYMGLRKQWGRIRPALKTRSGKFIVLGALLGGPIGMSGYVASIKYLGPTYTAILSALFPALGALLSRIFLKEQMTKVQIGGLIVSILGVIGLSYAPSDARPDNLLIGLLCALLCVVGWASEAVILAYGMKDPEITDDLALMIRQTTSSLFYAIAILPILAAWPITASTAITLSSGIILLSALFGTASYLLYYKAINRIGAAKAMALNITYAAWSVVFSLILLHNVPDLKSLALGVIVILGSLVAANGLDYFAKIR